MKHVAEDWCLSVKMLGRKIFFGISKLTDQRSKGSENSGIVFDGLCLLVIRLVHRDH